MGSTFADPIKITRKRDDHTIASRLDLPKVDEASLKAFLAPDQLEGL